MFVVTGVSGNTGSVVAKTLLAKGQAVRVVVRDAAKGEAWRAQGAEVAVADLNDEAALTEALRGASGVYLLVPPDYTTTDHVARGARLSALYVRAAKAAGVGHAVLLSSFAAQHAEGTGVIRAANRLEQAFRGQGLDVTIIRAGYFAENWGNVLGATQQGVLPNFLLPLDKKGPMVATQDIGEVAAEALVEGGRGERIIELAGPEDYSPNDAAACVSELLGKPVQALALPQEAIVPALNQAGLPEEMANQMAQMYQGINSGHATWQGEGAEFRRGHVTLRAVIARLLGQPAA